MSFYVGESEPIKPSAGESEPIKPSAGESEPIEPSAGESEPIKPSADIYCRCFRKPVQMTASYKVHRVRVS